MRASWSSIAFETRHRGFDSRRTRERRRRLTVEELFIDPCVAEAVIDADRGSDEILDVAAGDGGELQFELPCNGHVFGQNLLHLGIDFPALRIREGDCAVGDRSV